MINDGLTTTTTTTTTTTITNISTATMGPSRRIYSCDYVTDFLRRILYHNEAYLTTILVCSTREHFLEQLVAAILSPAEGNAASEGPQFLTKTIGLLSQSSKIKLVFCPSLENLRAYISVLSMASTKPQSNRRPLLGVLNPLALHRSTSEFSAQGLSRTLAAAVEVTARQGVNLVLCECLDAMDGEREPLWSVQVPLLNQTARIGADESTGRGGNVTVKRVVQRWFEFEEDNRMIY